MLSIKSKLLVMALIANLGVFAVNDLNKVEVLYKDGKYEKAYKKAYKLKSESAYFKKAKTYYFMGFSLLNLSKDQTRKLGVSRREKTIVDNVSKGLKYQKNEGEFSRFKSEEEAFLNLAKSRLKAAKKARKDKEWKAISKLLAKHFKDTTPEYWEAFPVRELTKNIKPEEKISTNVEVKKKENKNQLNSRQQDQIISKAKTYIGTPYLHAGTSKRGIDCSGFTSKVLNQFGTNLPHSAKLQSTKGKKIKKYQAGDLAFFGSRKNGGGIKIQHVAIVISNYPEPLKVIHATSSLGVRIDDVTKSSYWKPRYLYSVRVL